ncbi:MAG TPA: hypothetical protein VKT78_08050 [Fimbriimonadaceae bacterium]|nr:hypothetical protein [Fimbriimonadaceae bacterium]
MRLSFLLPVAVAAVCCGCSSPPGHIPHPSTIAWVRIVNLSAKPCTLSQEGRALGGTVQPDGHSPFNYISTKGKDLSLKDDQGKELPLPAKPAPGDIKTYVVKDGNITTLTGEDRTAKAGVAVVSFRALDSTQSVTLTGTAGDKIELKGDGSTDVNPGTYKAKVGSGPETDVEVLKRGAYTVLVVDGKKAPMLLLNNANPKVSAGGAASS